MFRLSISLALSLIVACVSAQKIALTFDDAPTEDGPMFQGIERTKRILEQLKDKQVKQAAFFVVTSNILPERAQRVRQYAEAGHVIANHTHSHRWIHQYGLGNYLADIKKADSILKTFPGYYPYFRFPFLDEGRSVEVRDSIRAALSALGLRNGYVTVDNYDWYLNHLLRKGLSEKREPDLNILKEVYLEHIWNSIEFYDHIAVATLGRSPNHVLLLHENDLSALFLGDLIEFIRSKGWEIISVQDAYADPISSMIPDVTFNGQGRVGAIAREKGMKPAELVQQSEDEVYLDNLVREKKVFK
jgi:peptidoglycan-N-acetylglucosamine deacetylase